MTPTAPAPPAPTAEMRWHAVLARDARYDGSFVYAVRSTGVYCRPSCPSRRPRRGVVTFYAAPSAAEAAGFRACRRCRPNAAGSGPETEWVRQACAVLDRADGPVSLGALARTVGVRPEPLRRAFAALTGITPRQYAEARRTERLRRSLRAGRGVSHAVYGAGFSSPSRVYERPLLGMTPATYAKGGRGARITYVVAPCPYGRMLVATTERGVCRVALADRDDVLERDLRREFPHAEIRRDAAALQQALQPLLARIDGRPVALDLPLDVRATAFQSRVWTALRRIPFGETRSYGEVARAIGQPRAVRAVARACAANPVAIVVPCHRVVRADGEPGGYRWGVERKAALLASESRGRTRERPT